jgi:hypothetical protein
MAIEPREVHIERPCEASFDAMSEVASGRYCDACDKTVHDLARMTEREVRALLARGESLCVRYVTTQSGTVRTAPTSTIPTSRLLAKAKPLVLAATALAASACGPTVDALPEAVVNRMPYGLHFALRHPLDFVDCLTTPGCDPTRPQLLGAIAPAPTPRP